ncbi:MAG: type 3 dihydrofolate reductase [Coxiellaceae bacterium]|nr:type 3 dihydrofolate reductase [Coxiellaceae bacterium]
MLISLIVAYAKNRVIGKNNQLPWHLPADLKHFKQLTMGKPIVMGRKTFESIGRPLLGRRNIIISRGNKRFEGCDVFSSIDLALSALENEVEIMIIGGATLFSQMASFTEKMYITEIDAEIEGDTFFPEINEKEWEVIVEEAHLPDEKNPYLYKFKTLQRKIAAIPHDYLKNR